MDIGLFAMNINTCADPAVAVELAQAAESAGFNSLWTGEHVVLPATRTEQSPFPATAPLLDAVIGATLLATATTTIRIGTGIIVLPLRNPVVLAKELASLDVISGGRLMPGFGVGYLDVEFDAVGVPMAERGQRMDEYIEALIALWTMDTPTFEGRHVSFSGIDAHPRPAQKPTPPIVIGGGSEAAVRRAWRRGHVFYAFGVTKEWIPAYREAEAAIAADSERPAHLGPLQLYITPVDGHTPDDLRHYEEAGVDGVVLMPGTVDPNERHRAVPRAEIMATIDTTAAGYINA
ncbi:MAG: TIGR03619 family F420-dependent LLM class oxidoreductase [Actinomycetota bacterium]